MDAVTGPKPITKQRSPWVKDRSEGMRIDEYNVEAHYWSRRVSDGTLWAILSNEPWGWHLSISFRNQRNELTRYPSWDELTHARYELLPSTIDVVMHLPPPDEYVAVHDTTFHLHEHPPRFVEGLQ